MGIERQRAAENIRRAFKTALPEGIAQDGSLVALPLVVLWNECAAQYRLDAERAKQAGGNIGSRHTLRAIFPYDSKCLSAAPGGIETHMLENLVLRQPVGEVGWRYTLLAESLLRIALPDHDEPVRLRVGQRRQQNCLDDAEENRICSDPEHQGEDDCNGKTGIVSQRADGISQVVPHGLRDVVRRKVLTQESPR